VLGDTDLVAFLPTTDVDRAREFFADVLGLRLVEDTPFAAIFDAHGTSLRVTPVEAIAPAEYTVLGWTVDDMAATARALTDRGVRFMRVDGIEQDDLGVWTAPGGALVAWFKDPDGNTLSLTEHPE
jgi:catechol 2,3-dioxygenase-like lactoylglutathione lyase family enzyme